MIDNELVKMVNLVLNAVVVPLMSYTVFSVRSMWKDVRSMWTDLRAVNGRLGKVEQWTVSHEKLDDERQQNTRDRLA